MNNYEFGKNVWRDYPEGIEKEWLITNGIGGYANLTVIDSNARSFSGCLNISLNPPADRMSLLNNISEQLQTDSQQISLCSQHTISEFHYGFRYLSHFHFDTYPTYTYQVNDFILSKSIGMPYGQNTVVFLYDIMNGLKECSLILTPSFTLKPLGSLINQESLSFTCLSSPKGFQLINKIGHPLPIYFAISDGSIIDRSTYQTSMASPNFLYQDGILYDLDIRNGLNSSDTTFTPYDIKIPLAPYEHKKIALICSIDPSYSPEQIDRNDISVLKYVEQVFCDLSLRKVALCERASYAALQNRLALPNDTFLNRLIFAADAFIVHRKSTGLKTILAGYPWFLDWGRDTMIAFTGLTLCTGRFDDAREILLSFAKYLHNGLLPNVFPNNASEEPQYNTMDASLWYFYAIDRYLTYTGGESDYQYIKEQIYPTLKEIIKTYQIGTDFHIGMDDDGLIAGGGGIDQITWMDVRVGDWVVTPRHGKPVEINALWYNALCVITHLANYFGEKRAAEEYQQLASLVKDNFTKKFWNPAKECLFDVITRLCDGTELPDPTFRPNQIYAVSLPYTLLPDNMARKVVDQIAYRLYTPLGIRSLSSDEPGYQPAYIGPLPKRDGAYHMGTSWAYLSGAFLSAYLKVYKHNKSSLEKASLMFQCFSDHVEDGCLGGIAEIFDGTDPCTSRGCYTQAWSVGELLRSYMEDYLPYQS